MFYKMIENKCTQWYESERCTVKNLIEYIEKTGQMRDAQIEAIKVYLFLKIACECKPLTQLFRQGFFNSIDLNEIELSKSTREYLFQNPAAATLFEYACLTNDKGEQVSEKLEKQIKKDPTGIDYNEFFRNAFYGVSYTDYLFSLPMGAGKTYLMAAFIYLDLYFAYNEPTNPSFAHNFIIFAPSGLKSSVVPSLKTIQNFNPSWILPEPAATDIKRMISFEVLDQSKTAKKSNKTKNPNVQKIANHQPLSELFGLVAVTNAEKVILERIQEKQGQINMFEESEDDKDRQANELRNLIGKLPSLSIFIDEVHHAVSDEIKLRAVVTRWAQNHTVNSVIGFSGTPYLDKVEKIKVVDSLSIGTAEITNIVYYYPLIDGVGNFLKRPVVKIADIADSSLIIEKGVREFLDTYKDTVYADGLTAKLGIYCGTIEKLEETVYPQVSRIVAEYGLGTDVILKFHKGNKQYKMSADSQMQFDILDKSISEIRIVLLVQIGKEGWDCRSLTGIILSQEGDCPTNMVLQTSCRCLRQVIKNGQETALIYLNESNAEKLNMQLERQHHISLKEFSSADNSKAYLKVNPKRTQNLIVQEILLRQDIISNIENYLCLVRSAETLVNDSKKSAVDICTNTLAYAMATEKEKELLIKVFQKIEENIQQYSVEKLSRYSNAMSGIGLSSLIEEWIVQNELTEKIYTETELLYVITELYLQICGDFRYQEHIQSICKKWIDGQTPMEINNKETIGIAEVESLCNKRISYEMNFLIGNICDLIEVDGENEEQVDQRNILTLLQKKVKYGVPNMTAISICESVFNDRLLAIELAQILSDANIGTDKILNMLKAHSEEIFSCLDSYPEYFKDRLSVLMK